MIKKCDTSIQSIDEINIQRLLNQDSLDRMLNVFAPGPSYYFTIDSTFQQIQLVSENVTEILGVNKETFSEQGLFFYLHPEDLEIFKEKTQIIIDFFNKNLAKKDIGKFKAHAIIRLKNKRSGYSRILQQVIPVVLDDSASQISNFLVTHIDVTYLAPIPDTSVSFISPHQKIVQNCKGVKERFRLEGMQHYFTKREFEIIKKLRPGSLPEQLSSEIGISPNTLSTHIKNILRKSGFKNSNALLAQCLNEGLI